LGNLKERAITVTPGQKIAYVVDAVHSPANAEKIIALAAGADTLFIEAMFQDRDSARAAARFHLTACQAGNLARRAGVRRMVPFHFSPRYTGSETLLRREAEAAFAGRHFERPVEEDHTRAKA
jgi:ribonuclease Z